MRCRFQSTLPSRGATSITRPMACTTSNFNPRSPRGERRISCIYWMQSSTFQSTLPSRGATFVRMVSASRRLFQSTLPSRGATGKQYDGYTATQFQSTLPSRGATQVGPFLFAERRNFNPRSPRGERRNNDRVYPCRPLFQSTLPSRGATQNLEPPRIVDCNFNPRSPRGERRIPTALDRLKCLISIHAPLAGSDLDDLYPERYKIFQSTLPSRGATG